MRSGAFYFLCIMLALCAGARGAPALPCNPLPDFHIDPGQWNITADQHAAGPLPGVRPGAPVPTLGGLLLMGTGHYAPMPLAGDFSDVCRYQAANQKLPRHAAHRVVMMGDSITDFWVHANPALFAHDFVDRGISGQTSGRMLLRFRQDVLDLRPAVVVILGGTNDINGPLAGAAVSIVEDNIQSMVELALSHDIQVVLATLPPFGQVIATPEKRAAIAEVNHWLAVYARKRGAALADYHAVLVLPDGTLDPKQSVDALHPNQVGYLAMEAQLGLALSRLLP